MKLEEGEGRSMTSLSQSFHCDASTMTWLVDRLEERGLVERRLTPSDRRVKAVALTPQGAETKTELMERMYEPPEELLTLDRASLDVLKTALTKVRSSQPQHA
jgi:DNA-binding MarR family transcriptional regulator